jgi:hypothetical protein
MTAKDKAKELVDKFNTIDAFLIDAKKCALIAVEQVRFFNDALFYINEGSLFDLYLDDVKKEIEKL